MAIAYSPSRASESPLSGALVIASAVVLALLTLYLVGFDQGVISRSGMFLHELMHDGRHLLGLPCH
ncbi:CbtB domain-containing protein [Nocardia sp. CNY236]|uniref:CbtB domain-containing protein n=1 Tax=Nocardia sp. CNY236 TaxID=1169152 RepID=UPI00040E3B6B|nr:CbtB domain-containing protein [Nocardia sp. CNY236]